MQTPPIVSAQEWAVAHAEMLVKEKELTRARDALAAQRRRMPWTPVENRYAFDGPEGRVQPAGPVRRPAAADRVPRRSWTPVWRAGRNTAVARCSLMADHVGNLSHLNARDTTLVYASRGSQQDIGRIKTRMGWTIPWYTILEESGVAFDVDFDVDQWHGTNAFIRDGDQIFRTYFVNNRGDEALRNHLELPGHHRARPPGIVGGLACRLPADPPYEWWRWHDAYGDRSAAGTEQGCDSCADR